MSPLRAQEEPALAAPAPVGGEVSADGGTLWVEDDGAALYWHSGIALNLGEYFFLGFDLGRVTADLPWAQGSAWGFMGQGGMDTPAGGFALAFGSMTHPLLNVAADKVEVSNDGGSGFFFSIKTPLRFGPVSVAPYLLHGEASWDNGDLYWFFGKPKLPVLLMYGADISLDQQDRYQHNLRTYGFSADLNIASNEDESLFDASVDAGLFCYQFSREGERLSFTGTLGWLFAKASLNGALTSSNQPYFLFPFLFNNLNAHLEIQAGFAAFRFRHRLGVFQYSFNLGALHIFHDQGGADMHYKMKNFFGGEEAFNSFDLEVRGLGAAFLALEAGLPALPLTRRLRLSLGLQKLFAVPWGYEKILSSDAVSGGAPPSAPSPGEMGSLLRTALLSGLSVRGSIIW